MFHQIIRLIRHKTPGIKPLPVLSRWHSEWRILTEAYSHNLRRYTVHLPHAYNERGVVLKFHTSADSKVAELVALLDQALTELSGSGSEFQDRHSEDAEVIPDETVGN